MVSKQDLKQITKILESELEDALSFSMDYLNAKADEESKKYPIYVCMNAWVKAVLKYKPEEFVSRWITDGGRSNSSMRYHYYNSDGKEEDDPIPRQPEITLKTIDINRHPAYQDYKEIWEDMYESNVKNKEVVKSIEKRLELRRIDVRNEYQKQKDIIREFLKNVLTDNRPDTIPKIEIKIEW